MYRLLLLIALIASGCKKENLLPGKQEPIKVIAKLVTPADCDKLCSAKYVILNSLSGHLKPADTIHVGYYSYLEYTDAPETAILTLERYTGTTQIKNYYIFPDYNAKKGLRPLNIPGYQSSKWERDTVYNTEYARVFATQKVNPDDIKEVQIKFSPYLFFEDFKVAVDNRKLAKLDLSTHEYGRMFRSNLRDAYRENKANFAGHYTLATWGCGSPCQQSLLIDRYTGKIYDAPASSVGVDFRPDSKMLIVSPPEEDGYYWDSPFGIPEIYVFNENDKKFYRKRAMYDDVHKPE